MNAVIILFTSTSDNFKGDVHQNFVPIFEYDLQIDFKVNMAPLILHRGTRVVPRQNHVDRNIDVSGDISIADLNKLNLCFFIENFAIELDLFNPKHL